MINKTLSQLAADYANGAIDKDKYRKERGDLLQGIVAGQIPVESIDYLPPLDLDDEPAMTEPSSRDTDTTQVVGSSRPPSGNISADDIKTPVAENRQSSTKIYIAVSSAIVIVLIIAVVLFYPAPPETTSQETTTSQASIATAPGASKAGEDLIATFLKTNIWTQASLDEFVHSWQSLSSEEQLAASSTKRMQRLSASIYNQFLEEKALASIDSEKALKRQQALIDFARSLGINDARLVIE